MNNKKTILIVEDEKPLRDALSSKLTHEGFAILQAGDGQDGLKIALQMHPDLILLDIILPVMDGMTMLKQLRQDTWGKEAKIIVLTNLTDEERISESFHSAVFDYLIKTDWKLEDLVQKIKNKLNML
jgi:DNA-binding response OmpR family regulator